MPVLLLTVVIVTQNVHTNTPTSFEGVHSEVLVGINAIEESIPAGSVAGATGTSSISKCPGGRGGHQIAVSRTITLAPDFDRLAWLAGVAERYTNDGWSGRSRTLGDREHVELTLVGPQLLYYRVRVSDESGASVVIIRSTSRCTASTGGTP